MRLLKQWKGYKHMHLQCELPPYGQLSCSLILQNAYTQGNDGRIISNTSNSPRFRGTATLATACERSRQERLRKEAEKIAAAKKAAFVKATYTDKGAIAVDCTEFLTEKARIRKDYVPLGGSEFLGSGVGALDRLLAGPEHGLGLGARGRGWGEARG
ncbi:hypothetical protein H0H81_012261 [Sphagnurus paluster]|uniref:Uncharacterized protein n=1 Tax=Sphagnurus paluster TaxID=117069 RepID=A0A9P7GUZ9_9AGAR|nr:hypothetical protein H0H81_012261 [Sphagnurus paluster]